MVAADGKRPSVMFVESSTRVQDVFREALKSYGFRVLVTSDPERAISRFQDDANTADCVVFSAGQLGDQARDAFCRFATDEPTRTIPAALLLAEKQKSLTPQIELAEHHIVTTMPRKTRELRNLVERISQERSSRAES